MTLILSKAPTLGEEKGLEETELSLELANSITSRAHERFLAQCFNGISPFLFSFFFFHF